MSTEKCASHGKDFIDVFLQETSQKCLSKDSDTLLLLQVKDQAIEYSVPNKSS